jgi:hypothetical protein
MGRIAVLLRLFSAAMFIGLLLGGPGAFARAPAPAADPSRILSQADTSIANDGMPCCDPSPQWGGCSDLAGCVSSGACVAVSLVPTDATGSPRKSRLPTSPGADTLRAGAALEPLGPPPKA